MCKLGTPKIIAISNRDVSKAQVTTWQTNATEKKDGKMWLKSSSRITRNVRSTKSYKRKYYTHLSI
jgi:hypothetical protein